MKISPQKKITIVIDEIKRFGFSRTGLFAVAPVERRMAMFSKLNNINLAKGYMYMSGKRISHSLRDSKKQLGLAVTPQDLILFPERHRKMLLFYDGEAFIYTDMRCKFIVNPNYNIKDKTGKKNDHVVLITAGLVKDVNDFKNKKYKLVY